MTRMITQTELASLPEHGWRQDRPFEDPQKTKRWGFVAAKPSEFLVHVRRGAVRRKSSGQGASCFKWPWDAVSIIPTSLQRSSFRADQVTSERVGVEVVGLAVYRIVEPLIAYRVLNFSYPERAQQKLEQTLTGMFVGATRRLVANLTVDQCLQKRKSALAEELIREVSPVVAGDGRPEDDTDRGWGIVIDTIEIQEVRVLSEKVFAAMQAPYRAALDRHAREARAEADKSIALREAECMRAVEEERLNSALAIGEKQHELERAQAEAKKQQVLGNAAILRETEQARLDGEAMVRERQAEIERREASARTRDAVEHHRLASEQARAELEAHAVKAEALARRLELDQRELTVSLERRRAEAEIALLEGKGRAEVAMEGARAERERAEAKARVTTAENLPALAHAVGQKFGEVKVTQIGEGTPFGSIAQAVAAVVELARSG
jgi:flotillin